MAGSNPKTAIGTCLLPEIRISDFDHFVRLFSQWDGKIEQLSCGRFDGSLRVARGRQIQAHLATANQVVRVRGQEGPGKCTVTLVLPESAACLWQRRQLDSGSLVIRDSSIDVDYRTSKQAVNFSCSFSHETIRSATRSFNRLDIGSIGWRAIRLAPASFQRLDVSLRRFLLAAAQANGLPNQVFTMLEQECLIAIAEAFDQTCNCQKVDLQLPARTNLVRKAEELMRSRMRVPTGELDLCKELGTSGRTLRLAFRERFGLGPMAYYQAIRLNAARNTLKTADPESSTVAHIARSFGFNHMGKFAGYYRRQFGELPSEASRQFMMPIEASGKSMRSTGQVWAGKNQNRHTRCTI